MKLASLEIHLVTYGDEAAVCVCCERGEFERYVPLDELVGEMLREAKDSPSTRAMVLHLARHLRLAAERIDKKLMGVEA